MCLKKFNEFGKNQNKINESTEDKPMVKNQLENMIENINEFLGYLSSLEEDLPAWVQDKVSVSNHSMEAIANWASIQSDETTGDMYLEKKKNSPTDKKLWNKALNLAKGTKHGGSSSVRVDGESYDAPNDGKGFEKYPSAYANSYAAKMYKKWGGSWKLDEDLRDWHDEKWVRVDTSGNITGECGSMKDKDKPSRCLPEKKAKKMNKKDRAATARKKKAKGKDQQFVSNTKKAKVTNKDRKKARS